MFLPKRCSVVPVLFLYILAVMRASSAWAGGEELERIKQHFLKGEYDRVAERAMYVDPASKKKEDLAAYYYVGTALIKLERYDEARNVFLEMIRRKPDLDYLDKIEMRIGDSYLAEHRPELALARYRQVMAAFPESSSLPRAYEEAAKISQGLGKFSEARNYFNLLQLDAPLSFEAIRVRRGVTEIMMHFGVQVGSFADPLNAEQLKTELELKGYAPYVASREQSEGTFYRVRIGHFSSRREAELLAQQVESLGYAVQIFP